MANPELEKLKELEAKKQAKIVKQWKAFAATNGREAYADLMEFIDSMKTMYVKYGEERAMPHPVKAGDVVPIDNDTIAALLQNSRGLSIVKTYIQNRVESDVAQSNN